MKHYQNAESQKTENLSRAEATGKDLRYYDVIWKIAQHLHGANLTSGK